MRILLLSAVVLAGALGAEAQDKPKKKLFLANEKEGVSIQVPATGKDQLWECKEPGEGQNFAVMATHIIDTFQIYVFVQRLAENQKWPDGGVKEIAKNSLDNMKKPQEGEKEARYKEVKVKESDPKYRHPGLGPSYFHKLELVNQADQKSQLAVIFTVKGNALYQTQISFGGDEMWTKYWPKDAQAILASIKTFNPKKDKDSK